jgi:catechol 2,3-dioxygenase-like lactoylglutathione lyase family enzyme
MPLGHLGVNVSDLDAARRYYGTLLPALRFEPFLDHVDEFAYRPAGGKAGTYLFFYPSEDTGTYSHRTTGLQHLAFAVPTRADVVRVRDLAVSLGSVMVEEPRVFPQYPQPYFACFWHDPDGFLLEAVCHHDRD